MVYASIWDWRTNHIPLNRAVAFAAGEGYTLEYSTFTRQVGWGSGAGTGHFGEKGPVSGGGILPTHNRVGSNGVGNGSMARKPVAGNGRGYDGEVV